MKNTMLLFALLISVFSPSTFADENDDGKITAINQCNRLRNNYYYIPGFLGGGTNYSYYLDCLDVVDSKNFFQLEAIEQCKRFNDAQYLYNCIQYIGNRRFNPMRLEGCNGPMSNELLLGCIKRAITKK